MLLIVVVWVKVPLVKVPLEFDIKAKEGEGAIDKRVNVNWKGREDQGCGSVHSNM